MNDILLEFHHCFRVGSLLSTTRIAMLMPFIFFSSLKLRLRQPNHWHYSNWNWNDESITILVFWTHVSWQIKTHYFYYFFKKVNFTKTKSLEQFLLKLEWWVKHNECNQNNNFENMIRPIWSYNQWIISFGGFIWQSSVANNKISGTIPTEVGMLTLLQYL
jgi:hypothetical protein